MTDLERHILRLLLDNDCVIVPGFGGFMAHYMPAKYDEKNNLFSPPMRIVGFNPQLNMNDSLLAHEYVNTYDLSYPEALRHIALDVEELKRNIDQKGSYDIFGIGRFTSKAGNSYEFSPDENGLMTPNLYGLDMVKATPISTQEISNTHSESQSVLASTITNGANCASMISNDTSHTTDAAKSLDVHIPMRFVKHIAAACIVLLIMLTIPSKLGLSSRASLSQSSIDTSLLYEIMPKEMTSGKPERLDKVKESSDESKKVIKENTSTKENSQEEKNDINQNKPYYSIVLASRVARANAEEYVKSLHHKGYTEARVYTKDGATKVIYKQFKTREEASEVLNKLTDNIDFEGCWVTEIR